MSKPVVDPRIAPKEMIVTRNKSAQQRMQLREKARASQSLEKITDLQKPDTNKQSRGRTRKKLSNVTKLLTTKSQNSNAEFKEYYPDKLRRKFEERKRVYLRPKYESKTVVKLNKRKMGTPKKGGVSSPNSKNSQDHKLSKPTRAASPVYAELSIEEVVRIVEETEILDDEDLMEILTCPSPVWWEEPSDKKYIEEAIFIKKPIKRPHNKKDNVPIIPSCSKHKISKTATENEISKKLGDDKFLNKCNKLENLLGNIKNKSFAATNVTEKVNDELNKAIGIETTSDTNQDYHIKSENPQKSSTNIRKPKKDSESNESLDLNFDDELIKGLENMDIPVANEIETNDSTLEVCDLKNEQEEGAKMVDNEEKRLQSNESPLQVPENLPPLIQRPNIKNTESPSVISISEETDVSSMASGQEFADTISDTNIKFISDDDTDVTNIKISDNRTECANKADGKSDAMKALNADKEKMDEYITVYKIISNDAKNRSFVDKLKSIPEYSNYVDKLAKQEAVEDSSKYSGQLISFFKKCKNVYRKKILEKASAESESNAQLCGTCEPKKFSIDIAQEENVKYCLKCSSIFDTDECRYCLNTKHIEIKDSDKSVENLT